MRENLGWFRFVVLAQAAFVLAWAGWHEHLRTSSPTILLRVSPVDPRDLLRGDYMILNYDISQVPLSEDIKEKLPDGEVGVAAGRTVFVVLEKKGNYWEYVRAAGSAPEVSADQIVIQGNAAYQSRVGKVRINYGIERFYVPEGKGSPSFKELAVRAAVSGHKLYLKELLVDGHPYP